MKLRTELKIIFLIVLSTLTFMIGIDNVAPLVVRAKNEISEPMSLEDNWIATVVRKDKSGGRVDEFCLTVVSTNPENHTLVINCKTGTSDEGGIEVEAYKDKTSLFAKDGYTFWEVHLERYILDIYWSVAIPNDPNWMPAAG